MQRYLFLCVLMIHNIAMNACDICGCSVMSGSPGILPKFRSHFIGFRESMRQFENTHPASILNPDGFKSTNTYSTHELWGRWYPHKRIQVFGSLPYNDFTMTENGVSRRKSGFGDASMLVNYLLFNTGDSVSKFKHLLMLGAGAKLNTGHYDSRDIAAFQVGSGTKDYQLYLSYTARYGQFGGLSEITTRRMGTNPNNYNFGDKVFCTQKLFYWINIGKNSLLPHIGYSFEHSGADRSNQIIQDHTGGNSQLAGLGLDWYVSNFNLGFNVYKPVSQSLGDGLIKESPRVQFNMIYIFNKKPSCH